ncbi:MAG: ribonuclease III [Bacillota bacterium]
MKLPQLLENIGASVDEELLRRALTHSSYANENSGEGRCNERMEFLGDAVLDLVVSEHLFRRDDLPDEGVLSSVRASLVRTETLGRAARSLGLGEMLHLGRGERDSGGQCKVSILADTYEAVVAAVYLSCGLAAASAFVDESLQLSSCSDEGGMILDAKSTLEQVSQRRHQVTPRYEVVSRRGPDHAPSFTVRVSIAGEKMGIGSGKSKQKAEEAAAQDALRFMGIR